MPPGTNVRRMLFVASVVSLLLTDNLFGGGGPENLALLVNRRSAASRTIANHYAQLRSVPAANIVYLDWDGPHEAASVNDFRDKILGPALKALAERGVLGQIDYLVYSADFPYSIDISTDGTSKLIPAEHHDKFKPIASITGLTYLWQMTMARLPEVALPSINRYMRATRPDQGDTAARGFRSWYGWGRDGRIVAVGGQHYMLSTMLGVTHGRGNSVDEILYYLRRSASADGSRPRGTIYFAQNGNIRSQVRHGFFPAVVEELRQLGVRGEIVNGLVPEGRNDVQGCVIGTSDFDWAASGSKIQAGAIVENFTSFGGWLRSGVGQTPLSEPLRHGAAGASGTVTEPFALLDKFPHPRIHVHYAAGCSLAEAFYQAVHGPYQLLIVGDPLCRPWADIPKVNLPGVTANMTVKGLLDVRPTAGFRRPSTGVSRFELFVDGVRRGKIGPGGGFRLDVAGLPDGHHELRVVAIDNTPIETQGRAVVPIRIDNHGRTAALEVAASRVPASQPLAVTARSPGAARIAIMQHMEVLATIEGDSGRVTIDAARLPPGPAVLRAVAQAKTADQIWATSPPVTVEIAERN